MQMVFILVGAMVAPFLGLSLLLWLAHLEDTLPRDVQRARRRPDPAPILAMPVRVPATQAVVVPAQRAAAEAEPAPQTAIAV